ncbi:MAG: tRNA (guanine(10)-N(2))-dimethyltransferase [Candidatus Ranarchaeia archaeon]
MMPKDQILKEFSEGGITFLAPRTLSSDEKKTYHPIHENVFYNPRMELNRDATIAIMRYVAHRISSVGPFCDAFAGTGIRSIRVLLQVPHVPLVVANDINPNAVEIIKENARRLNITKSLKVENYPATFLFEKWRTEHKYFGFIDIDPFGSPTAFLDSAISATKKKNGYLAVTATDMPVLCGIYPLACKRKYASQPLKTEYVHETALRILIYSIICAAGRQNRGVSLRFAYSDEHYIRAVVQLRYGGSYAQQAIKDTGYIAHCFQCQWRIVIKTEEILGAPRVCPNCGDKLKYAGPLYAGSLFHSPTLKGMINDLEHPVLNKKRKLLKLLETQLEESDGPPTFYDLHRINALRKHNQKPRRVALTILREHGFFASKTHFSPTGVRTNASITDIIRLLGA